MNLQKSFRSQEVARERNKFEQRKLNIGLTSKSGPEAIYKLNLEKLEKEQRQVARDLGRIAHGPPKRTTSPMTLRKERTKEIRLIEQRLQTIRRGVHRQPGTSTKFSTEDKRTDHPQTNIQFHKQDEVGIKDSPHSKPLNMKSLNAEYSDTDHSNSMDGFMIIELLAHTSQNTDNKQTSPPVQAKGFKTHQCVNQWIKTNHIDKNPSSEIEFSQAERDLEQKSPSVEERRLTQSAGKHKTDYSASVSPVPHLDLATETDMSYLPSNRRSSKSGISSTTKKSGSDIVPDTKRRVSSTDSKITSFDSGASGSGSHTPSSERNHMETAEPTRRPAKSSVDLLKKSTPVKDPEFYNPDGSLKTWMKMPTPEKAWEQAEKARYLRTRDPRECDRELSNKEIFAKH